MKRSIFLLLFLFTSNLFAQDKNLYKFVGFEIYLVKDYSGNPNSFRNFKKNEIRKFKRKFKNKGIEKIPDSICHDYLNWEKVLLSAKPFLSEKDIKYYSWNDLTIYLNESGIEKIRSLKGNVRGIPFAIVINGIVQFGGKFRWKGSSHMNDRVYTSFESDYKEIKLRFFGCGNDPRNSDDFKTKLIKKI